MKAAVRAFRLRAPLTSFSNHNQYSSLHRFYSAQPQPDEPQPPPDNHTAVFDSSHYDTGLNPDDETSQTATTNWDVKYRNRVKRKVFDEDVAKLRRLERELEKKNRTGASAQSFLAAALDDNDKKGVDPGDVKVEDQRSLSVGIMGPPNAGKSALTNCIIGTKVAAVSRKVNATTQQVLGVWTQGATQICFFDTPGVMLKKNGIPYPDIRIRNQSSWSSMELYDVLIVMFDVDRHLTRPDSRVIRLIHRMGSIKNPEQKRILCINKIDLVPDKKDLSRVADEFSLLPGYDRQFLVSGLKGAGIKELTHYLTRQSVKRPWDEDPFVMSEEVMKRISLEVVREKLLDHVHQEIPYGIEHRLMDWIELNDGSLRIEQHFVTAKISQRKILIGSKGSKIGRIGIEANEELRSIYKKKVHLFIKVLAK